MKKEHQWQLVLKSKLDYLIDNITLPLLAEYIVPRLWSRGDLAYYLCDMYEDRTKEDALFLAIYNLLVKDNCSAGAIIEYVPQDNYIRLLDYKLEGLPRVLKNSPFDFELHCADPQYQNHHVMRYVAGMVYSLIHSARNLNVTFKLQQLSCVFDNISSSSNMQSIVLGPVNEEIIFRVLLQKILLQQLPKRLLPKELYDTLSPIWIPFSVLAQSVFFAAAHYNNQTQDLPRLVSGLILGYQYEKTGNILVPIVSHILWNAAMAFMSAAPPSNIDPDILAPINYQNNNLDKLNKGIWLPVLLCAIQLSIKYCSFKSLKDFFWGGENKRQFNSFSFFSSNKEDRELPVIEEVIEDDKVDEFELTDSNIVYT